MVWVWGGWGYRVEVRMWDLVWMDGSDKFTTEMCISF